MIQIIPAQVEEAQEIRQLESQAHGEEVTSKYDISMFVQYGYVFVAKEKEIIVGAIIALATKDGKIKVNDLVVHPQHQRKGIGTGLYQKLIAEVSGKEIISIVEENNTASLQLHLKLGFEVMQKIDDPFRVGGGKAVLLRFREEE